MEPDAAREFGSPAHAGMVPRQRAPPARRAWLPRTRGDGPSRRRRARKPSMAPPHTRGWSLHGLSRSLPVEGSPAHAGMVPSRAAPRRAFGGLPRTRGDGPSAILLPRSHLMAPPHTRGWSPHPACQNRPGMGSPAHAGMVPSASSAFPPILRLPRTRGDGPDACRSGDRLPRAPPHTRGWSVA